MSEIYTALIRYAAECFRLAHSHPEDSAARNALDDEVVTSITQAAEVAGVDVEAAKDAVFDAIRAAVVS
jgi:DNA repair protein RadC